MKIRPELSTDAEVQEGTVPVTVTVTCPTDNRTATASVNIQVLRPVVREFTFEDVHAPSVRVRGFAPRDD
jgi:hypothetical protein